jgi:hypothetical protein
MSDCQGASNGGCGARLTVHHKQFRFTPFMLEIVTGRFVPVPQVYCPFDGCPAVMECAEGERGPDSICALCK